MCLRQLVVSPALIREYSRHMRRHVPTLGACRGLGSRRLPARLKDVCAEIDPISALSQRDECEQCQKSRGRLVVLGIVNMVILGKMMSQNPMDLGSRSIFRQWSRMFSECLVNGSVSVVDIVKEGI